jgi:hypothetical protein
MTRIIGFYGSIAGIIVAIGMWAGISFIPKGGSAGMAVGYLTMLVALSFVFVGVKQYRDNVKGGIIRFWTALGVGLSIAVVASLFYVGAWEIYMYNTNYTYMDKYISSSVDTMRAAGKSASGIANFQAEMVKFKAQYAHPLFRVLITFTEIAPVGFLIALISAALLRNAGFMPSRAQSRSVS